MDPAEAWGACEFQLSNWTAEGPAAAQVWAPAAVLPHPLDQYASIDIDADMDMFGACWSLEAPVAASMVVGGHGQQLVVREVGTGVREPTGGNTNISNGSHASGSSEMLEQKLSEFKAEINLMKEKMHRYPASLQGLSESYTVPRFVAIGPYHHDKPHLKQAEKVKAMAAICYVKECGYRLHDMYSAVVSVADGARRLYDEDAIQGITSVDFQCMMFIDACFLVQYMRMQSSTHVVIDPSLHASMRPNRSDILHDVLLLENQLPWKVVQTVKAFLPARATPTSFLPVFISSLRTFLRDQKPAAKDNVPVDWAEGYNPPHLLGLLRYYIVGRKPSWAPQPEDARSGHAGHRTEGSRRLKATSKRSVSHSAIELAKLGIRLIPTKEKTTELIHMGLNMEAGLLHAEFSLQPLSLNRDRASYLVNMAAFELCTVQSFGASPDEDSAVCSYLLLLAMLAYREEDVHELRVRGLLQGGGGLTNEDALRFFTSLQGLRLGKRYLHIMQQIARYQENRPKRTKWNEFWYHNKKIVTTVFACLVSLAGITGTLVSIKNAL